MMIHCKRAYDAATTEDGQRFLVDRLWPRGISHAELGNAPWLKDIAPSEDLRHWFAHDPAKWPEFRRRYTAEIAQKPQLLPQLRDIARQGVLTMVYSANDEQHNDALVLQELILHPPTATGP